MMSIRPLGFAMALLLALPGGARAGRVCPPASLNEPLPGVAEVMLYQSSVSTAQFPGQWQEGEFGGAKLAYRLFSDGSGTVSSDRQLRGWVVDFTCNLQARSCTYRAVAAPPAQAVETARSIGACLTADLPRSRPRPAFPQAAAPEVPVAERLLPSAALRDRQGAALAVGPAKAPAPAATAPAPVAPKAVAAAASDSLDVQTSQSGDAAARGTRSGMVPDRAETPPKRPSPALVLAAPVAVPPTAAKPGISHQTTGNATTAVRAPAALAHPAHRTATPVPVETCAAPENCQQGAARQGASPAEAATYFASQGPAGGASFLSASLSSDPGRLPQGNPQAGLDLQAQCPVRAVTSALAAQPVCWADRLPEEPVTARIQRMLLLAGYDAGPVDGRPGTRTHAALVRALGKDRAGASATEVLADLRLTLCDASYAR